MGKIDKYRVPVQCSLYPPYRKFDDEATYTSTDPSKIVDLPTSTISSLGHTLPAPTHILHRRYPTISPPIMRYGLCLATSCTNASPPSPACHILKMQLPVGARPTPGDPHRRSACIVGSPYIASVFWQLPLRLLVWSKMLRLLARTTLDSLVLNWMADQFVGFLDGTLARLLPGMPPLRVRRGERTIPAESVVEALD